MTERTCRRCGDIKPATAFYLKRHGVKAYRLRTCAQCINAAARARTQRVPGTGALIPYGINTLAQAFYLGRFDPAQPRRKTQ